MSSSKWEGEIRLKFHENGYLASATLPEVIDKEALVFIARTFPVHVSVLAYYRERTKARITAVALDTSFEAFWDRYSHKRGSKPLAQQYWDGQKRTITRRPINEEDRQIIMRVLPRFLYRYPPEKKDFQPLASTYLHQRLWESEVENLKKKDDVDLLKLIEERRRNHEATDQ